MTWNWKSLTFCTLYFHTISTMQFVNESAETFDSPIKWESKFWKKPTKEIHYLLSGYDYDEAPIPWDHTDYMDVVINGGDELKNLHRIWDQFLDRVSAGFFQKEANQADPVLAHEIVMIWDFDNIQYSQVQNVEFMKFLLDRIRKFERISSFVKFGFILNVNAMGNHVMRLGKLVAPRLLQKFQIYGTNRQLWIPQLLKQLPRIALSLKYGGTKDFKPVAEYG